MLRSRSRGKNIFLDPEPNKKFVLQHCPSLRFWFDDKRGRGSIRVRDLDVLLDELLYVEVGGWGVVGSREFDVLLRLLLLVDAVQGDSVAGRLLGELLFEGVVAPVYQCCGPCFLEGGRCNGCDNQRQKAVKIV